MWNDLTLESGTVRTTWHDLTLAFGTVSTMWHDLTLEFGTVPTMWHDLTYKSLYSKYKLYDPCREFAPI
jgi:hypothetical protein